MHGVMYGVRGGMKGEIYGHPGVPHVMCSTGMTVNMKAMTQISRQILRVPIL